MSVYAKLVKVQNELKAPKGQYNSFGKYKYRNQEDILEAAKPILLKYKLTLFLKDEVVLIGDRYYIKATCVLVDIESGESLENTALARESVTKKGMDDSQVTGSTSSYARKYALNGLFLIDDTKDADTDEFQKRTATNTTPKPKKTVAAVEEDAERQSLITATQGLVDELGLEETLTELEGKAKMELVDMPLSWVKKAHDLISYKAKEVQA